MWDDDPYIILNDAVKNFDINALLTGFHVGNFHPLTMLTLAVEYALVGENPWLYHLNNLLFHAANSILVYRMFLLLKLEHFSALIIALFFALHPMHVESVAWAAERKDVLYTFFLLLAFNLYIRYIQESKKVFYLFSLILFVLSCLSKGMAVVLPALLLITDWWMLKRPFTLKNSLDKIPYFIVTLVFAYIATTAQKDAGADASSLINAVYTFSERLKIVGYSFLFYWVKTLLPVNLLPFYPYPAKIGNSIPSIYSFALVCFFLFAGVVYFLGRKNKKIWWGVAFFLIAISTVLQILPVGSAIVADRYYYLSSIGPLYLLVLALNYLPKALMKPIQIGLAAFFGLLTFFQVGHWKNLYTLFTPAEKVYKEDSMVLSNLGWYYLGEENFPRAKEYLIRADNNGFKNADVCRTIGSMYIDEKEYDKALPYIERAFQYKPEKPRTDWLMALALSKSGKNSEALPFAQKAVTAEPDNLDYKSTLASILAETGNGVEARKIYEELAALSDQNTPDYLLNVAYSYRTQGDLNKEVELLKQLILQHPDYLPAYKNIGLSLDQLGRQEETIAYWKQAAEQDPSGDFEYNIGINYAARQLINQAIPWYQKAAKKGKKEAIDLLNQNGVAF